MAPKRKKEPAQQTLEEVTDEPVVKKRSKKGALSEPKVTTESSDGERQSLFEAKMAKKHGKGWKAEEPKKKTKATKDPPAPKSEAVDDQEPTSVSINRAPVLTLWVAVVAQRQGLSRAAGLTFGKSIAGLLAQSKGRSIGKFEAKETSEEDKAERVKHEEELGVQKCDVFGMKIKAVDAGGELRALDTSTDTAVDPGKVQSYLKRAFGDRLDDVESELKELADSFPADRIGDECYHLYEQFRPEAGWGKKGHLDFKQIRDLKSSE